MSFLFAKLQNVTESGKKIIHYFYTIYTPIIHLCAYVAVIQNITTTYAHK